MRKNKSTALFAAPEWAPRFCTAIKLYARVIADERSSAPRQSSDRENRSPAFHPSALEGLSITTSSLVRLMIATAAETQVRSLQEEWRSSAARRYLQPQLMEPNMMTLPFSRAMFSRSTAAVAMAVALSAGPALAVQEKQQPAAAGILPSVLAFDQKLDNNTVKLAYVYVPKKSVIAIYNDDGKSGMTGDARGILKLEPGDHRDVKIQLNGDAKAGAKMWVTLYEDTDADGKLTKSDVSYWKGMNLPTENGFIIR